MTLTDIRTILSERDLQLTKSLGQNFLHDQNQVQRIAAAGQLTAQDRILEIGPGLGPLTEALLASGARVTAIEKDDRLYAFLAQKFKDVSQLELIHGDALAWVKTHREWGGWKLVANLPYSVASPILVELAQAETPPERMVATLQMEVARRIDAPTGDKSYGIFGLLLQLHYEPVGRFKIPPSCFFPEPEVDSACVTLVRRSTPLLDPALHSVFVRVVKRGFSQRRKMMLKLLKQDWPAERLAAGFVALGLSPQIRAEAVSLEQFAKLAEFLGKR